jgi:hypothetical protein
VDDHRRWSRRPEEEERRRQEEDRKKTREDEDAQAAPYVYPPAKSDASDVGESRASYERLHKQLGYADASPSPQRTP